MRCMILKQINSIIFILNCVLCCSECLFGILSQGLLDRTLMVLLIQIINRSSIILLYSRFRFSRASLWSICAKMSTMTSGLEITTIDAQEKHTATVIFLHGLGDSGQKWVPIFESIRIPSIKYILPTAPTIPVTWQDNAEMPAWFNIKRVTKHEYDCDERGFKNAVSTVHKLLEDEIKAGIASDRIILCGFSQGGGLALHSGLTFDKPLAALIGMSCRLPLHKRILAERRKNLNIPILHCHGESDLLTPMELALSVSSIIKEFNRNNYTFKVYPKMLHTTCEQELRDVKEFIAKHLPPKG